MIQMVNKGQKELGFYNLLFCFNCYGEVAADGMRQDQICCSEKLSGCQCER